jgi:hypothetical protein
VVLGEDLKTKERKEEEKKKNETYRHVILPLRAMPVQIPLLVVRRNTVQCVAHIGADILVPVFVQRERARSVLDEQVEEPDFVVFDFGQFVDHAVGDEVAASRARGERELLLEPGHGLLFASALGSYFIFAEGGCCIEIGRVDGSGSLKCQMVGRCLSGPLGDVISSPPNTTESSRCIRCLAYKIGEFPFEKIEVCSILLSKLLVAELDRN